MAAAPDGTLLIAFRNPVPNGKALVVPLANPAEVVKGDAAAKFGLPTLLDLGGRGVRSIEYAAERKTYHIVAGPQGDDGEFALYEWTGPEGGPPERLQAAELIGLNPEAIVVYGDRSTRALLRVRGKERPWSDRSLNELLALRLSTVSGSGMPVAFHFEGSALHCLLVVSRLDPNWSERIGNHFTHRCQKHLPSNGWIVQKQPFGRVVAPLGIAEDHQHPEGVILIAGPITPLPDGKAAAAVVIAVAGGLQG